MPRPLLVRERASLGAPSQNCSSSGEVGMVRGETSAMPRGELGASMLQRLFCMADILHSYRVIESFLTKALSTTCPSSVQALSKTCPSSVQALSKPVQTLHFYVQAWKIRLQKYCNLQHGRVQAFRPTGLFIILKGETTPMQVLRSLRLLGDARESHLFWNFICALFDAGWCLVPNQDNNPPPTVSVRGKCFLDLEIWFLKVLL